MLCHFPRMPGNYRSQAAIPNFKQQVGLFLTIQFLPHLGILPPEQL